jgi:hypothetical protein
MEAKSPKMAACELLLALASYNLIRGGHGRGGAANQPSSREISVSRDRAPPFGPSHAVSPIPIPKRSSTGTGDS